MGKDQKYAEAYSIVLVENYKKEGMRTVDFRDAFRLVQYSCKAKFELYDELNCSTVDFSTHLIEESVKGLENYVSVLFQTFTEEEKAQARANIGAVSEEEFQRVYKELLSLIQQGGSVALPYAVLDEAVLDYVILA